MLARGARRSRSRTLAVAVVLLLCALCLVDAANDHAQLHSFFPPILQHYWQNGFLFWSFGKQTVVTDQYVRLTENAAGSSGYLWNRHENQMGSFEFKVTARMLDRDGSWFSSGNAENGIGIWYAIKSANPLADTSFYGFETAFDGFGVVLDHSNGLTLYAGHGGAGGRAVPKALGRCAVSSLKENFITIAIGCDDKQEVTVSYIKHDTALVAEKSASEYTKCLTAQIEPFAADTHRHFGVTASNGPTEQTVHDIHSIFMIPLSDVEKHEMEEQHVRVVHLFDEKITDKITDNGHGDAHSLGEPETVDSAELLETTIAPRVKITTKKKKKKRAPQ